MLRPAVIAFALAVATVGVYAQTASFDFIEFDDDRYVSTHTDLLGPFDGSAVSWAFEPVVRIANWQPVTLLSYRFDALRHGIADPGPYHVTNVVWHVLATLLLFGALRRLTGRDVESGLVAALFALHPLHVESVAWISSRKDVLVAAGWWAATWAYVSYAQASSPARRAAAYVTSLLAFTFALLAKPLAVTLPFTLLLFDVWPLNRWTGTGRSALRLGAEKIPFFVLTAAASVATLLVQRSAGAMESGKALNLLERLGNSLVAASTYVTSSLWPSGLAAFYPHPASVSQSGLAASEVLVAATLLAALTGVAAFAARRGYASVAVGWCFFLGTLVPVLGLVQVGFASHADRYTYIAQTGLAVAVVFGCSAWLRRNRPAWLGAALAFGIAACGVFGVAAHRQASLWKDTPTLFEHALAVTERNDLIQFNYGTWLKGKGDFGAAKTRFAQSLEWNPQRTDAAVNLGLLLHSEGERERGLALLRGAVTQHPHHVEANLNLGIALAQAKEWPAAREHFQVVIEVGDAAEPAETRQALISIATIDRVGGDLEGAAEHYERALELGPDDAQILGPLVDVYSAIALRGSPSMAGRAVDLARKWVAQSGGSAASLGRLARAYLAWGDRGAALATVERALERARSDAPGKVAELELLQRQLRKLP